MNSPFSIAMSIVETRAYSAQRAHKVESIVDDIRDEYGIETDDYIDNIQILKHQLTASRDIKEIESDVDETIGICEYLESDDHQKKRKKEEAK